MVKNLKSLRNEKCVSQKQLADVISVSQQSINKYENHNIEPDIESLIRIADYFNTSVDYLIGHSKIKRKIEIVNTYDLNMQEATLIDEYRKLNDKQKDSILTIISIYNEK